MKENYIRQHYVWRFYLKPWAEKNLIWCSRNKIIFQSSLMKIAQEKYFYRTEELNENEIELIERFIESNPKENQSLLRDTFYVYLASSNGDDYLQKNGIEIFHGIVERRALELLEIAKSGNINILNHEANKIEFSKFVARQYNRTKKMKNSVISNSKGMPLPDDYIGKCDTSKIMKAMHFITSDSIGHWIFAESTIVLLKNKTNTKFITSDQPVFNLKAIDGEIPKDIELYYPISPERALLFTKRKILYTNITELEVKNYNKKVSLQAHEILFSTSKIELESFSEL